MNFRFFGTDFKVSFFFVAVMAALIATDKSGYIIPTVLAVIIHESSHLLMMVYTGCRPKEIRLIPGSVMIIREMAQGNCNEILISLSGPAANLIISGLSYIIGNFNEWFTVFSAVNLLLGAFNLLPLRGVDGGAVLYRVLSKAVGCDIARVVLAILTVIIAAGFVVLFFITMTGSVNISFLIMGVYFLMSFLVKL